MEIPYDLCRFSVKANLFKNSFFKSALKYQKCKEFLLNKISKKKVRKTFDVNMAKIQPS